MRKFRTAHDWAVTFGKNDTLKGYAISVEYAEGLTRNLRKGTQYTIWQRRAGRWWAYRTRTAD